MHIQKNKKIYAISLALIILSTVFLCAVPISAKGETYIDVTYGSISDGWLCAGEGDKVYPGSSQSENYSMFNMPVTPGYIFRVKCTLYSSDYTQSIFFAYGSNASAIQINPSNYNALITRSGDYYYIEIPDNCTLLFINFLTSDGITIQRQKACEHPANAVVYSYTSQGNVEHLVTRTCTSCDDVVSFTENHHMESNICRDCNYVSTDHTHTYEYNVPSSNGDGTHDYYAQCKTCTYSYIMSKDNNCSYKDGFTCFVCGYVRPLTYSGDFINWLGSVNERAYNAKRVNQVGAFNYYLNTDSKGQVKLNGWCYYNNGITDYYGVVVDEFSDETRIEYIASTLNPLTNAHTTSITKEGITPVGSYTNNGLWELTFDLSEFDGETVSLHIYAIVGDGSHALAYNIKHITVDAPNATPKPPDEETTTSPDEEITTPNIPIDPEEPTGNYMDGYFDGYHQGIIDSQLGVFDNASVTFKYYHNKSSTNFPSPFSGTYVHEFVHSDQISFGTMYQYWFVNPNAVDADISRMTYEVVLKKSTVWLNESLYLDGTEPYKMTVFPSVYVYSGNNRYKASLVERSSDLGGGYYINISGNPDIYFDKIEFDFSSIVPSSFSETFLDYGLTLKTTTAFLAVYDEAYMKGFYDGENEGLESGYNKGQSEGYDKGYSEGAANLENEKNISYEQGFHNGYKNGTEGKNSFYDLITACYDSMSNFFFKMFSFEILGVNVASFIFSLVSIGIAIFIVKIFI